MRRMISALLCVCTFQGIAAPAFALDAGFPEASARAVVDAALTSWAADPVLIAAINAQNERHAALTPANISALDAAWMAELGQPVRPTIDAVLNSTVSDQLRQQVEIAAGQFTEIFVMDNLGLNVASSGTTSDYWQGDEAKFTETYPKGASAMHVSEVEFDESTQFYQVQVSFSVTDPADGRVIGAVTVALNAERF